MKKLITILSLIFLVGCTSTTPQISPEEQAFNDSGSAKAILDESDLFPPYQDEIQGTWTSIDDPNSTIQFTDHAKIDLYDGKKMGEGTFEISGASLSVTMDGDIFEYEILELNEENLTLSYLPRGNTLEYKMIKNRIF